MADDAPIGEAVKAECAIENLVAAQVISELRERYGGVQVATDVRFAPDEPRLRLTLLWVVGGSHPGPKSVGLKADLIQGERIKASQEFRESSINGLQGLFVGACGKFDKIAKGIGEEIANWLPEVAELEALPKRPAPNVRPSGPPPEPLRHQRLVPPASGYAAIDDVEALPLREQGKLRYRHYLTLRPPKAFVIAENGSWVMTSTDNAAIDKSLDACVKRGWPCWVYAVDDQVVWRPEVALRIGKPAAPDAIRPAPAPVAAASDVRSSSDAPLRQHRLPVPIESGFADGRNIDQVPLSKVGQERYRHYLGLRSPKAFVVYTDGGWRFQWDNPDAMTELLDHCARQGKPCWLYAVDDQVVWRADPAERIGASGQLRAR